MMTAKSRHRSRRSTRNLSQSAICQLLPISNARPLPPHPVLLGDLQLLQLQPWPARCALKTRYVDALERRSAPRGDGRAADTIFFGGGTPSLLEPAEVARLIDACRDVVRRHRGRRDHARDQSRDGHARAARGVSRGRRQSAQLRRAVLRRRRAEAPRPDSFGGARDGRGRATRARPASTTSAST